jgi:hypothetical protein
MKKTLATITLILIANLYIGYYETRYVEDNRIVFFIKKQPTLQVKFENLFVNDADSKRLADLNMVEINIIRNYCKYRLGIDTWLQSQEELEDCKAR